MYKYALVKAGGTINDVLHRNYNGSIGHLIDEVFHYVPMMSTIHHVGGYEKETITLHTQIAFFVHYKEYVKQGLFDAIQHLWIVYVWKE